MVDKLFNRKPPRKDSRVLDPGCGPGAFIEGIIRWCNRTRTELPEIVGIENEPGRHKEAEAKFAAYPSISISRRDFLTPHKESFDYVIGNPPYVSITRFSEKEKAIFRAEYAAARGRFDLYLLFFEQALRLLNSGGRLVFITPEKFLYVDTARPLRQMLGRRNVREIHLVSEETFGSLVTYPTITTIDNSAPVGATKVLLRDGTSRNIPFVADGASLLPGINGSERVEETSGTLGDLCIRISCGVATGLDDVFVHKRDQIPANLRRFAYPTISGRQLSSGRDVLQSDESMLLPYDSNGNLLELGELGALREYLSEPERKQRLLARTCARRKPWYAFHETPPLKDILRPKLLCKDIASEPHFWIDRDGLFVPRHSVYYIVSRYSAQLDALTEYLNGPEARAWIKANCQRAANGFIRLQSAVLKRLPVPAAIAARISGREAADGTGKAALGAPFAA